MIDSEHFTKIQSNLNLFYENDSILSVKTRICGFENFTYNKKFPTLLNMDSYFTELIVLKFYEDVCHSGADSTLNFLRLNFWIITGREIVKKLLKSCFSCKFVKSSFSSQVQHLLTLAIRQVISRRGRCNLVISNNFRTSKSEEVKNYLRNNFIKWDVMLDRSPWWGVQQKINWKNEILFEKSHW